MALGRYESRSVSNKDLKEPVMALTTKEGASKLTFTFVPTTGTLPSEVLVGKDQLPKILIGQDGTETKKPTKCERNVKMKTYELSESFSDAFHKQISGNSFPKEDAASNSQEEIKHNDLFIAEFVVVMDSDEGEDENLTKMQTKAKDYEFIRSLHSTTAQQKQEALAKANVNEKNDPETQYFRPEQHLYLPTTDVNSHSFQLINLPCSSPKISKYKRCMASVPVNTDKMIEDVNEFPQLLHSQESRYLNVSHQNAQPTHSLNAQTTESLSHSQIQSQNAAAGKCIRSNAMSPLPIKIIKHPLCQSPSPLNSQLFGSSSTIYSRNDSPSPVPRPEAASRLSFLTSLLKSKKSTFDRTASPYPSQCQNVYTTAMNSSPPRKSQSCFALNYPKDFKMLSAERKHEKTNLSLDSDIIQSEPLYQSRTLRSLSPDTVPLKSSAGSFYSRKGVVSPLLDFPYQPNKILNSSKENISTVNEKPPLNRQSYTPLKKYSVLGKSRKVTLFPPPLNFQQPLSNAASQKQNVMPYSKRYVPVKGFLRPSSSFSDNLDHKHASFASPMETTERCRLSPTYPNTYKLFNENEYDISPTLLSNYTHHFESSEELSRNSTPMCTSPTNILGSPSLSRSCQLQSADSLSQNCDQENKQSYKIKSSYKSFAAIPTNTLLRDQKAIDKSEINTSTASKENMDPHQEMCSPALLRQQTEEICAVIDEVLHDDPLPKHYKAISKPTMRKRDAKSASVLKSPPKSAGRETKYSSIQHLANTRTNNLQTRPGVIRPISLKINATGNIDGQVSPIDFH